jgi:hypothetical protein
MRDIALSNSGGELQSCDRHGDQQSKDFFHGDSSLMGLASLSLSTGSGRILPVRTSIIYTQIIVFADTEIALVARNAIRTCSISVARNATIPLTRRAQTPQSARAPRAIP